MSHLSKIGPGSGRRAPARRLVLCWGWSLAAAAGLAVAVGIPRSAPVADSGLVEVGEGNSSATVYVDAQSGWLVVWAVSDADRISTGRTHDPCHGPCATA
ncbi:MAG: hypothetical protein RL324_217 [Verrucomicrobiota bacterium]